MMIDQPITLEEQIDMMKKYVTFVKRVKMRKFLKYVGYFRASRYGKYLLSLSNVFQEKPSQDLLYEAYNLDVILRDLFFRYCRKAEIQFKSHMANAVSLETNNPIFYLDESIYTPSKGVKDKVSRNKNKNFFNNKMYINVIREEEKMRLNELKYPELNQYRARGVRNTNRLPAWAFFAYTELGMFINMYAFLNLKYQKGILKYGYVRQEYSKDVAKSVETWLNAIRTLRNICAHHSKLIGLQASEISIDHSDSITILESREDLMSRIYSLKKILNVEDGELLKYDLKNVLHRTNLDVYKMNILPEDWEQKFDRIKIL